MIFILFLFLSVVLQITVAHYLKIFDVFPNLILVALLLSIIQREKQKGLFEQENYWVIFIYSLMAGLALDLFSGFPFGAISFSLVLTSILIYACFKGFLNNMNFFYLAVLTGIASLLYYFFLWAFFRFSKFDYSTINIALIEAVLNIILISIFYAYGRFRKILY